MFEKDAYHNMGDVKRYEDVTMSHKAQKHVTHNTCIYLFILN